MQRLAQSTAQKQTRRGTGQKIKLSVAGAALCSAALASLSSGCNLVNPPQPVPTATPVATPVPDIYDSKDGVTAMAPLNGTAAADPTTGAAPTGVLPAKFRVVNILSGELLQLQSLSGTAPNWVPGTADVYHLAGIVTAQPGQPGYAETVAFIAARTLGAGKEVDVEQDPRFPLDLSQRRMVQVYYNRSTAAGPEKTLLNRMMVRQGFAVVDINAATSIDTRAWLNDEEFARKKKYGLNALGISLGLRAPLSARTPAPATAPGGAPAGAPMGAPPLSSTTTTTTTTTVGAPPAPGAPAPAGMAGNSSNAM